MNVEYTHLLPEDFSDASRVWIYQSNRIFRLSEALELEVLLENFAKEWTSHGALVKGYANLFFGQFIILMADESDAMVSGCSTDGSVRLMKEIESRFQVDLFNRNALAFLIKDKVELLPMTQLQYAFQNNFIHSDTPYFNNLVLNKKELQTSWIIPVKESWLAKKLKGQPQL